VIKVTHNLLLVGNLTARSSTFAWPEHGLRLASLLELDPLCEKCRQTEPPRSGLVIIVGPLSDSSVLNTPDRCAFQGNWNLKASGSIIGHSLRCRKLPFSNGEISALEGRLYFQHGVREKLPGFLKEFDQVVLVRKLEVERMVGEREVVVKPIHSL